MSDVYAATVDVPLAIQFNRESARCLGWYGNVPEDALKDFPDLFSNPEGSLEEQKALVVEVLRYQQEFGLHPEDGMLGRGTWLDIVKRFDHVDSSSDYVVFRGRRVALPRAESVKPNYKLYPFDKNGGLDLHAGGDFHNWKGLRSRKIRRIVLHWGGHDAKSCSNALFNRDLSSHVGVERGSVFQWLDFGHLAWHAGYGNTDSIGIDICQQPTINFLDLYLKRGLDVRKVKNPARRPDGSVVGEKVVLSLDSRTEAAVADYVRDLCTVFDVPFILPRNDDGSLSHRIFTKAEFAEYEGVLFHSHLTATKWDIAPWGAKIFDGVEYVDAT